MPIFKKCCLTPFALPPSKCEIPRVYNFHSCEENTERLWCKNESKLVRILKLTSSWCFMNIYDIIHIVFLSHYLANPLYSFILEY